MALACEILTCHADEIARKRAGDGVLVRENGSVLLPCDSSPPRSVDRIVEADTVVLNDQLEINALVIVERVFLLDRIAHVAPLAAHEAETSLRGRGMEEECIVEALSAAKRDEPSHLLEALRRELDAGRRFDVKALLSARNQTLLEERNDAFAAIQAQVAFARLEARDPVVDRDARGLPLNRQLVRIEIVARRLGGPRVRRQLRRLERVSRQIAAAREPRPSVLPDDGLNRRLAPEDGAAVLQWPAAEMREAPATVAMLNERSVSCRLQAKLGIARARNERIPRHDL